MSLLNEAKAEVKAEAKAATVTTEAVTKKHSNSEYQKKAREKARASALLLKKELGDKKVQLSPEASEALSYLCKEGRSAGSVAFGQPVFNKLFGDSPKVGDKITALKVFEVSGKGFAEMRQLMKKWKEKQHIEVVYDEAVKSYTIKAM